MRADQLLGVDAQIVGSILFNDACVLGIRLHDIQVGIGDMQVLPLRVLALLNAPMQTVVVIDLQTPFQYLHTIGGLHT
jgi:hypothetical protein